MDLSPTDRILLPASIIATLLAALMLPGGW